MPEAQANNPPIQPLEYLSPAGRGKWPRLAIVFALLEVPWWPIAAVVMYLSGWFLQSDDAIVLIIGYVIVAIPAVLAVVLGMMELRLPDRFVQFRGACVLSVLAIVLGCASLILAVTVWLRDVPPRYDL